MEFMADLAPRFRNRIQLTTDGYTPYPEAVEAAFGDKVHYGITKKETTGDEVVSRKRVVTGNPDMKYISTSLVERQNLTMRMSMRRLARLTNAHSKSLAHHAAQHALDYLYYNYARPHASLMGQTPAQAAGLSDRRWTVGDLVGLLG